MENVFNEHADDYEAWFKDNNQLFQSEVDGVRSLLTVGAKRLEIGCGTGLFSEILGVDVGVDPAPNMLERAREKGITVARGDATHLPIADQSYEEAIMITVDCFLEDLESAFHEAYRVLESKGRIIVAFIDIETPLGKLYEANKSGSIYYEQANFHSAREIMEALVNTGFTIGKKRQCIYSLDNVYQETRENFGEGVFAMVQGMKK